MKNFFREILSNINWFYINCLFLLAFGLGVLLALGLGFFLLGMTIIFLFVGLILIFRKQKNFYHAILYSINWFCINLFFAVQIIKFFLMSNE